MRSGKAARVISSIIYTAVFTVLCISGPLHESDAKDTIFGPAKVQLSIGAVDITSESLVGKIDKKDIKMLGHFSDLKTADFRGSACSDEIAEWVRQNPQVSTLFSVRMPDGSMVDNDVRTLDLSHYHSGDVAALTHSMSFMSGLELLSLGDIGGNGLQAEDVQTLSKAAPQARLEFNYHFRGASVSPDTTSMDLSDITGAELAEAEEMLLCLSKLESLTLSPTLTLDEAVKLAEAAPNATLDYPCTLYGKELNLGDAELDFSYVKMNDEAAQLIKVLPHMKNLRQLDMDTTGVSYETLEKLRTDNPGVDVVFRIWFGTNYSVRTDVDRILASKPTVGGMIGDDTGYRLKYCTQVEYLDLGHNDELHTGEFLSYMPNLKALIIAMTDITDISGLAGCKELNYLELNSTNVSDISALASCVSLRDLNIACCPNIDDITALYDIPLDRLWIGSKTPVPQEQVEEYKRRHPDCVVNTTTPEPTEEYWRYTRYDPDEPKYYWVPRYEQLRHEMGYNYQDYSFYWLDHKCDKPAPPEHAGKYGKEVYGY